MPDTISRVTVFKLKAGTLEDISFPHYSEIKNGTYELNNIPYPYRLFFLRQIEGHVDWFNVFAALGLTLLTDQIPKKISAGFIFIVKVGDSIYAVTGGLGHIHLKKSVEIEYRFGIDIAEKILSLAELRGLAQKDTSGIVNSMSRIFRGRYNPNSDINNLKRVLTHIRGKLSKRNAFYVSIGKTVQASDALSVNGAKDIGEIFAFLAKVDELWRSQTRQITIPQLDAIDKKISPDLLAALEARLVQVICDYSTDDNSLFLDNEDIGYLPDRVVKYSLIYDRQKHECDTYAEVLEQAGSLLRAIGGDGVQNTDRVRQFHKMGLRLFFDDDTYDTQDLFYFICGDVTYDNDVYFINNKHWYKASDEFVSRLNAEIDNIEFVPPEQLGLVEWDTRFASEDAYNEGNTNFICLDRKLVNVAAEKGGIEFCDLLKRQGDDVLLVHVKNECGAALRALFAQGFVAAKLYDEDTEFRNKVVNAELKNVAPVLTNENKGVLASLSNLHKRQLKLIYAIFDNTPSHAVIPGPLSTSAQLNGTLTTFAKVDLLERVNSLRAMGYNIAITRIKPYPQEG